MNADADDRTPPAWDDGWRAAWAAHVTTPEDGVDRAPCRVVRIDKGGITVATTPDDERLVVAAKSSRRVVVGDVCSLDVDAGRIDAILERRTVFERRSPGVQRDELRLESRPLAANMDRVLVLQPLDTGVNEARLARELVLAWESGATPIVALTKADLVDADAIAAGVESATVNSPDVAVVVVSTQQRSGLDELRDVLDAGDRAGQPRVLALLGPSGAGKSTLANALAGHEVQLTAEVRDSDRRGRHTTTAGQMLTLDDHTWLIDTPGIRGVGLWAADDGLERAFADLSPFAQDCRFDDCSHRSEPDCGLRAAVERGDLAPVRLELWLRLVDELEDLEADLERRERAVERDDNQRARHRARGRDRSDD
jgi:ribosome biogenesis GTPase